MTTLTAPERPQDLHADVADGTLRLQRGDAEYATTPHSATDVAKLIHAVTTTPSLQAFVQKAKAGEGTGTLGLYVEAVGHTSTGTPFTHMKFFVVGKQVYAYSRTVGDSRANWRRRDSASLLQALAVVQAALNKPNVQMFGHPVLVELTADDLSAAEAGGMPPARFRGQYRIEKDFGRYAFEGEIKNAAVPDAVAKLLTSGFVTVSGATSSVPAFRP